MSEEREDPQREARPDDLASLWRLEEMLQRSGWRVEGRTPREWVAAFALPRPQRPEETDPVAVVSRIGLAAVPALVDTLRTERLASRPKKDLRIRSRCLEALGNIEPAPTCAIGALLKTLRVRSPRVQRQVLDVLAKWGPPLEPPVLRALLRCLRDRHEPRTRFHAANALSRLAGPMPPEVRRAVLERLGDSDRRVRWLALRLLGQLPVLDAEVCTALEEQAILDEANRIPALRLLARADPARAFPLIVEAVHAAEGGNEARLEPALKALRLVEGLGARAESFIPVLGRLRIDAPLRVHVEAVVDGIVRDQLYRSRPAPSPDPARDERLARLLQPVPPVQGDWDAPLQALVRWASGLLPLGQELCVRVALAAARRVACLWDDKYPTHEGQRSGLIALEEWVCEPSEENARRAISLGDNVPSQVFTAPDAFSASWCITYATLCLSSKVAMEWDPDVETGQRPVEGGHLGACLRAAGRALCGMSVITLTFGFSEDTPTPLSPEEAAREVRRAILAEVLPWLCGTWDPVKEPLRRRRELLALARAPEAEAVNPVEAARTSGHYP